MLNECVFFFSRSFPVPFRQRCVVWYTCMLSVQSAATKAFQRSFVEGFQLWSLLMYFDFKFDLFVTFFFTFYFWEDATHILFAIALMVDIFCTCFVFFISYISVTMTGKYPSMTLRDRKRMHSQIVIIICNYDLMVNLKMPSENGLVKSATNFTYCSN